MCTERKATGEYVLACCLFATMNVSRYLVFKDQPDFTGLHLLLTSVNIRSHFSDILNLPYDFSSLCLRCFCRL